MVCVCCFYVVSVMMVIVDILFACSVSFVCKIGCSNRFS